MPLPYFERRVKAMAKKVTTTPTTEHTRQFVKCFERLRGRHNAFNAFSDFLAVSAISISNAVNPNDEREQEYMRIINKYNGEEKDLLAEIFGCIVNEMQPAEGVKPRYYDVLGELFGGLQLHDSWKGQFFTPQNVSDMMALMTIGDSEETIARRGYISMLEPCIGGGANVIGVVNAMFQRGYNPCKQLLVIGYDLDPRCVHMSYIHLSLMGVPAMIQQRNSLSGETYSDYWFTPVFALDDWAGRLRLERLAGIMRGFIADVEKEKAVAEITTPPVVNPKPKFEQLTLF